MKKSQGLTALIAGMVFVWAIWQWAGAGNEASVLLAPTRTASQVPGASQTLTSMPTTLPTSTPTLPPYPPPYPPPATATPEGGCPPHPNAWHAPLDAACMHHHHGDDPRLYASVFDVPGEFDLHLWLDTYGELYQPLWLSSPTESIRGKIWLYVHTDVCEFGREPLETACITDILVSLHDEGTAAHTVPRLHSAAVVLRACAESEGLPVPPCGVLALPGLLSDYGILETPYKLAHCALANDPPGFFDLNQAPYRAIATQDRGFDLVTFWSAAHANANNAEFYPADPNSLVGLVWSNNDAYQVWDVESGCNLPTVEEAKAAAELMPVTAYDHSNFSLFLVAVYPHPAAPFVGWVDVFGHVRPECSAPVGFTGDPLNTCVPLIITSGFPETAIYNIPVDVTVPGPNEYFSPFLLPPWEDVP